MTTLVTLSLVVYLRVVHKRNGRDLYNHIGDRWNIIFRV